MVDYYMLNKELDKIKGKISIGNFDDTKILIDTNDRLLDELL